VLLAAGASAAAVPLSPAQTLDRRTIGELAFAPDGSRLAFVVTEPPRGETRERHVWMLDVDTSRTRQITYSAKSERGPRWSPDGSTLAFISDREGEPHLYVMPMHTGGEAVRLVAQDEPIAAFRWSPDGERIAFLMAEPKPDEVKAREKEKDDGRRVDRDDRHERIWVVDVKTRQARQISNGDRRITEIEWLGSGRLVAIAGQASSDRMTDGVYAVNPADGRFATLAATRGPVSDLAASPDGQTVAWVGARVDGPEPHDVWVASAGGEARNLTRTMDRPAHGLQWIDGRTIGAIVERGFKSGLATIRTDGGITPVDGIELNPSSFAQSRNGTLAYAAESTVEAPELFIKTPSAQAKRVTDLNEKWRGVPLTAPSFVHFKSFDGTEIEGALLNPAGTSAPHLPFVVLVHGGPTGRWSDAFEPWGQLLASRGYAVLYPNIRGSTGYGERFVEMNRGDWGGGDFKDVMAGVDAMVASGVADPGRLAIGGWSYGGYMAAWAITQTDRFKAAVSGAPMSDLASEYGTELGPAYDEWFYGVPYEKPDGFVKSSPMTHIKNAKTPTLILQGEADVTDPIGQSQQLYRGLKRYGVESELVLYPREGHGLREEKHLLDRLNRILAWYERFLKPPSSE